MPGWGDGMEHRERMMGTGYWDKARAEDKTDLHGKQEMTRKQGNTDDNINKSKT